MTTPPSVPVPIEKENISGLAFPQADVLPTDDLRLKRREELFMATTLGNLEHLKVKIIFESAQGTMSVTTTIWATTEKYISLKGGVTIPIHCIYDTVFL
ncbi:MAG: hypothetical protein HYY40_14315 [Bacteroidetes bacterium]|nr:hypothetical protein [Bacteroidota bacterium]